MNQDTCTSTMVLTGTLSLWLIVFMLFENLRVVFWLKPSKLAETVTNSARSLLGRPQNVSRRFSASTQGYDSVSQGEETIPETKPEAESRSPQPYVLVTLLLNFVGYVTVGGVIVGKWESTSVAHGSVLICMGGLFLVAVMMVWWMGLFDIDHMKTITSTQVALFPGFFFATQLLYIFYLFSHLNNSTDVASFYYYGLDNGTLSTRTTTHSNLVVEMHSIYIAAVFASVLLYLISTILVASTPITSNVGHVFFLQGAIFHFGSAIGLMYARIWAYTSWGGDVSHGTAHAAELGSIFGFFVFVNAFAMLNTFGCKSIGNNKILRDISAIFMFPYYGNFANKYVHPAPVPVKDGKTGV